MFTVPEVAKLSNLLSFLNYEHANKTLIYISGGEPGRCVKYKVENIYPSVNPLAYQRSNHH